ncbi:hypothetical protein GCM10010363_47130 [Streptomyces omiyaensis]|nr:hypothetical protein GCM10010363_47130 [Streptomyces omiyaensis]
MVDRAFPSASVRAAGAADTVPVVAPTSAIRLCPPLGHDTAGARQGEDGAELLRAPPGTKSRPSTDCVFGTPGGPGGSTRTAQDGAESSDTLRPAATTPTIPALARLFDPGLPEGPKKGMAKPRMVRM